MTTFSACLKDYGLAGQLLCPTLSGCSRPFRCNAFTMFIFSSANRMGGEHCRAVALAKADDFRSCNMNAASYESASSRELRLGSPQEQ
jgi:hypothetical protein